MRGGDEHSNLNVLNSPDEMFVELNKGYRKRNPIERQDEMLEVLNRQCKDGKPIRNQYKD